MEAESSIIADKELISFKGKDNYYDNYPLSVAFEKEILKLGRKIQAKLKLGH